MLRYTGSCSAISCDKGKAAGRGFIIWCLLQIEAYLAASLPLPDEGEPPDTGAEPDEEETDQQPAKKQKRSGAGLGSLLSPAMQEFLGCKSMPRPQVAILHRIADAEPA